MQAIILFRLIVVLPLTLAIACGKGLKVEGPDKPVEIDVKTDPLAYHKILSMYEQARDEADRLRLKGMLQSAENHGPRVEYECHNWIGGGTLAIYLVGEEGEENLLVSTSCGHEGVGTTGTFRFAKQLTAPGQWRVKVEATNQPWAWVYLFRVYAGGQDVCTYKAEARKEGARDIVSEPTHPKCDFVAK